MILSAHQPAYLPWLGYFDKIVRSDVFVFMDTVQFEKNSFINRNRIKTPQGPQWLTVPVKIRGHLGSTLRSTEIDETQPWRERHLKSVRANYARAAHFDQCFPRFERLFQSHVSRLSELCWDQLGFWLDVLGADTRVVRASELPVEGAKGDLVLAYCRHFGADLYVAGALGRDYLDEGAFRSAGIALEYQDYAHPEYPQLWGEFLPRMSIVDAWFNCGASLRSLLRSHP